MEILILEVRPSNCNEHAPIGLELERGSSAVHPCAFDANHVCPVPQTCQVGRTCQGHCLFTSEIARSSSDRKTQERTSVTTGVIITQTTNYLAGSFRPPAFSALLPSSSTSILPLSICGCGCVASRPDGTIFNSPRCCGADRGWWCSSSTATVNCCWRIL